MDLDIIIPCYNAKKTIVKTLSSICLQENIEKANIYLVNDCSDYDYSFYIDFFKNFINIKELKTPQNIGPGGARDYGMTNSHGKYIMFIDSDDYLYDHNSINSLYQEISKRKCVIVYSDFVYIRDNIIKRMTDDLTWLHGKIYEREFIEKYDIHFNNSRANEDNGFNRLILMLCKDNYYYLKRLTYIYDENPTSITRKNNREYKFTGLEGFAYNMNWAIRESLLRGANRELVTLLAMNVMVTMYYYYLELHNKYDTEKIFEWSIDTKKFLDKSPYYKKKNYEIYLKEKRDTWNPKGKIKEFITLDEFLDKIDELIKKEK